MLERPLIYLVPAAAAALYCAVCLETAPGLHLSLLLLSIFLAAAGAFIRRERLFTVMCMLAAASFAFSGFAAYRMIRVEPVRELAGRGQIATQYVDMEGNPTYDVHFNPNGSAFAVEGITSPDGRVFGKMGHSERIGCGLYRNVPGNFEIGMFRAAVKYFRS